MSYCRQWKINQFNSIQFLVLLLANLNLQQAAAVDVDVKGSKLQLTPGMTKGRKINSSSMAYAWVAVGRSNLGQTQFEFSVLFYVGCTSSPHITWFLNG